MSQYKTGDARRFLSFLSLATLLALSFPPLSGQSMHLFTFSLGVLASASILVAANPTGALKRGKYIAL